MGTRGSPSMEKRSAQLAGEAAICLPAAQDPAPQEAVMAGDDHVLHDRGGQAGAAVQAVGRHVGQAPPAQLAGVQAPVMSCAVVQDAPAWRCRRRPLDHVLQLRQPVAADPGHAHDLAGAHGEVHPVQQRPVLPPGPAGSACRSSSTGRPRAAGSRRDLQAARSLPTIRRDSSRSSTSAVSRTATTRPSRMTVTRSEISFTSSSLWVMMITVLPMALQAGAGSGTASGSPAR